MSKRDEHTIPWNDYELIVIDGVPMCYEWKVEEMIVRFPGGGCSALGMIKGKKVIPPEIIRMPYTRGS